MNPLALANDIFSLKFYYSKKTSAKYSMGFLRCNAQQSNSIKNV